MNAITRKLLCGAVLAALPVGGALACTTGAWDNGVGSGHSGGETTAVAGDPGDGIARYSGTCGLEPVDTTPSFVLDNTPAAEGAPSSGGGQPYRARFYVYAANPGGTAQVFRATESDDGGGAERVRVDFDGSTFSFFVNGAGAPADTVGVTSGFWYSIEIFYQDGEASTATVIGNSGAVDDVAALGTPTGTIGSIQLGSINGSASASNLKFDEFESTRSETTAIGPLCRGDANNDGNIGVGDAIAIGNDFAGTLATGQPDCNEDGSVGVGDAICVGNRFGATGTACF